MEERRLTDALVRMADASQRQSAADVVAAELGGEAVLVFVPDASVGALVPASGFSKTLPGGPGWRRLLARCAAAAGTYEEEVRYPTREETRQALAVASGVALVVIGGAREPAALDEVKRLLPLLSAALTAEQARVAAVRERELALEAARGAESLAAALDTARSQQQKALVETARLNRELEDSHRRKDEFLAMLAHELRNPLSPMVTALHLLQLRSEVRDVGGKELDLLRRQLSHLTRLVDDLLDVSRITRGRIELRRAPIAIQEVLQRAIESVQPSVDLRRHELSVSLPSTPHFVEADAVRLVQVFGNLLSNAVKYTDPGGHIRLELKREGGEVVVSVEDDGVGLSEEMLPRVFDLFVQAERSLDRSQGGLGIGLRLVHALVELHGGQVSAHSDGVGAGSRFVVRLPALEESGAMAPSEPEERSGLVAPSGPLRVLVVDDNRDAADSLAELVAASGHATEVVYDGLVALQVAADWHPDLVLLDIGLPNLNGFEVARRLGLSSRGAYLVALTGYGSEADRESGRDAGFHAYVVKPLDVERLHELFERAAAHG